LEKQDAFPKLESPKALLYTTPMPMTVDEIEREALALTSEQRARLADRLVESLEAGETSRIDQLWASVAKRRRDEVRRGEVQTIPGPEGLESVRRSLGR